MKLLHTKCIRFYKSILVFSFVFFACVFIAGAQQKNIAWYTANAPFKMPTVPLPTFADRSFSIVDFGAVSVGLISGTFPTRLFYIVPNLFAKTGVSYKRHNKTTVFQ